MVHKYIFLITSDEFGEYTEQVHADSKEKALTVWAPMAAEWIFNSMKISDFSISFIENSILDEDILEIEDLDNVWNIQIFEVGFLDVFLVKLIGCY